MAIEGVDVYAGKGAVDWRRVANAGKEFAFIRGAYGDRADGMVARNFAGAKDAGLLCGIYHFYRATRDPEAQAGLMVEVLRNLGCGAGDLPPVIDVEDNPAYDGPWDPSANETYIAGVRHWIARLQDATGRTPILYLRAQFWHRIGKPEGFGDHPLWVAHYGVLSPSLPSGWSDYAFWQYADDGLVAGVPGRCDLDRFNGDIDALQALL